MVAPRDHPIGSVENSHLPAPAPSPLSAPRGLFTQQQERHHVSFTDDGVARGVGVQSSEEYHAVRFPFALGETGTGSGDAGRRIHLVRAHCG
jgi:hypothetical protein